MKITRSEIWPLAADDDVRIAIRNAIDEYCLFVKILASAVASGQE